MVELPRRSPARILAMDEPTAPLSEHEIARLFPSSGDRRPRRRHHLHLIAPTRFSTSERITVLRDGRWWRPA
jgi:ribose transport system ATP-binding protein